MQSVIAAMFGLLIGVVGIWTGFRQLKNRRELDRWPTTTGRVIDRGTFQPQLPGLPQNAYRFVAVTKYVYQVNGRQFESDSINPKRIQQPSHGTRQWAQARADSIPDEVTVHYNPADPAESFLIQTPKRMLYLVIAAAGVAVLIGAVLLLSSQSQ